MCPMSLRIESPEAPEIEAYPTCEHPHSHLVYRHLSDGSKHFGHQCTICGQWIADVKKGCAEMRQFAEVPLYDDALDQAWNQRRQDWWQRRKEEDPRTLWRKTVYEPYINSQAWKTKKQPILRRDKYTCQICGHPGYEVHHLTYAHFEDEYPFELVTLCHDCHTKHYESTMT